MAATAAGLLLASATACGTGSSSSTARVSPVEQSLTGKTGPQVLDLALRALKSEAVVRLRMSTTDPVTKKPVTGDMRIQTDGALGSMELGNSGDMTQVISIKGRTYTKGDFGYLTKLLGAEQVKAVSGRWFYFGDADTQSGGATIADFADSFKQPSDGVTVDPSVATSTLDGRDVVVVSESDGSKFYVAASGKPLPLKLISVSDGGVGTNGRMTATLEYGGKPVVLKAPEGARPVVLPTPTAFPSGFPSDCPTALPSDLPSDFPTALPSGTGSAPCASYSSSVSFGFGPG